MPRNSRLISRQGKPRKVAKRLAVTLFFVLFCFLWFFPILYIVNGSLKSSLDWATNPRSFFPDFGYTLDNFKILFVGGDQGGIYDYGLDAQPITAWILNSLFASLAHTFLYLAFAILAAYVFVFLDFKGKNALFSLLLLKGGAAALSLRDTGKGACSISKALLCNKYDCGAVSEIRMQSLLFYPFIIYNYENQRIGRKNDDGFISRRCGDCRVPA